LKGVDLPKFSGEDKADYEPWRAALKSIVDVMDIPVGESVRTSKQFDWKGPGIGSRPAILCECLPKSKGKTRKEV